MDRCLALARRGAGRVSPNPLVGCVIVGPGGETLGEGWHARYGGPHAEANAIADAEARHGADALHEATLYVNLEPCAHWGKTPPCADLIIEKGIPRVVAGMQDPFPLVAGRGVDRLRAAGAEVTAGVREAACRRLNEAFTHHVETGRPLVVLKLAQTLDGFVATRTGDSRWVSSEASRARVHRWRSELDAVLVGATTALADDPALTVRHLDELPEGGRQPVRVVLDREGALPPTLRLFTDAHAALTLAVVADGARPAYEAALKLRGGRVLRLPAPDGRFELGPLLAALGRSGGAAGAPMQSVLVEAGPHLASALVEADLVDRLHVFVAPKLLGEGLPALRLTGPDRMAHARAFAEGAWETVGADALFTGHRRSF